jgi:pyruvate-formate lyase-activating enzyme
MEQPVIKHLPHMIYADAEGRIYDHPYLRMAGFSAGAPFPLHPEDLIPMPEFSKLFFIPECPPIGLDPEKNRYEVVPEVEIGGHVTRCNAVAGFLEPGLVRSHLPAADYEPKSYVLPTWAYTAVGFMDEKYWAAAFAIEYSHRWDPRNFDDRELAPAIEAFLGEHSCGPLLDHLIHCATVNHCFAAKNLFLKRWEAPLPVSRGCNAACHGCLSFQSDDSCEASHRRLSFTPSRKEITDLAASHLEHASDSIVSFGQGCEGEPLTEHRLIADSIRAIRKRTAKGTINLNTNGSRPERVRDIIESGLDSIRISVSSARPDFYRNYFRPKDYDFEDVVSSIAMAREMGLYTMLNYLVFPGITDQEEEFEALRKLIERTRANFLHLKNLNIDPQLYLEKMPECKSPALGIRRMVALLVKEFPALKLGYFNQPLR